MKPSSGRYAWGVAIAGVILHAWLIFEWPIIFGGDTILRMANRDHILLSYQLPGLQAGLHYLAAISNSAVLARCLMGAIGTVAGLGFYFLATCFLDTRRAFVTALLFVSNPYVLALSTVPYQEILMLAGVLFAFYFFLSGRPAAASLSLAVACLTRYEAWAACPVLVLAVAVERKWRPREVVKAGLLYGWAPLAWLIYRGGIAPGGTYVLDGSISLARLMRYVYLGWITAKNTPIPVWALALAGFVAVTRGRKWRQPGLLILLCFLGVFLVSILFSAHGVAPDPERFVTAREAHLLIMAVVLLAGFGLGEPTRITLALATLGAGLGIYGSARIVIRETSAPDVQLSYDLARYLDSTLGDNERAIILVKPFPHELLQSYLDKVYRDGGAAALADARRVMRNMNTSPPDYQRTLVHSRLGTRLLNFGGVEGEESKDSEDLPPAEWVAVWSNFTPGNSLERRIFETALEGQRPVQTLKSGPLSIAIYHAGKKTGRAIARPVNCAILLAQVHDDRGEGIR